MKLKLQLFLLLILILSSLQLKSQNNVGIGTTTPDANAILELQANNKGLLIPRMNSVNRTAMNPSLSMTQKGLLVFDTDSIKFFYWNGLAWQTFGSGTMGPQGPAGPQGSVGPAGPQGPTGAASTVPGPTGPQGLQGVQGIAGPTGAASTVPGPTGPQGVQGIQGPTGAASTVPGPTGPQGLQGVQGIPGPTGAASTVPGPTGPTGAQGIQGIQGIQGVTGPTGTGSSCLTMQQTYDGCSGSGSGRNIIISGTNNINITNANTGSIGLKSSHSGDGVSIVTDNTYTNVQYASIQASTASNYGVVGGTPIPTTAIIGNSSGKAFGVSGQIFASATGEAGIFGNNLRTTGGHGVLGKGYNGVVGESNYAAGYGVSGWNHATTTQGIGVFGQGVTGVAGQSTNTALSYGLYSFDDGGIVNQLDVGGSLFVTGTKSFIIDNPLDPQNKLLTHFCIESPEVLNLYRGTTTLDANGESVVSLPDYFTLINKNFSYSLTPVGTALPNLFVKEKINNNKFVIAGGQPGIEVSWVVYSERNDKYIQDHPELVNPQPIKTGKYEGKYIYPEGYNQPKEKGYLYKPLPKLVGGNNTGKFEQPVLQIF